MKRAIKNIADRMIEVDPSARIAFELWDGEIFANNSGPPELHVRIKSEECAREIVTKGFLGFGEGYTAGCVEVEGDLQELLRLGLQTGFDERDISFGERLRLIPEYLKTRNTRSRARRNIAHHYDRGDDLYALYLDSTMTYSCAYFRRPDESLEQAQLNKYEHIARKLLLAPGETLVDVGCGWGGMLIYAAQNCGIKGLGNTLSQRQYEYANRKIRELGLQDKIRVVLSDYRDLNGKFDKFVSIGMFEHVGKEFYPVFMKQASNLLKKGGLGLLHTIGKDCKSGSDMWIMKYIFPGAHIPALPEVTHHLGCKGLSVLDVENLRMHYAHTLDCWAANYEARVDKVREMFDDDFVRMWRLFLNACSAGFKYGSTRVYQVLFSNGLNNGLPATRDHVYST